MLIAVGTDNNVYQLTGYYRTLFFSKGFYNPLTHVWQPTIGSVRVFEFNDEWNQLPPPYSDGGVLLRNALPNFVGRTLAAVLTPIGQTVLACVGTDNRPYSISTGPFWASPYSFADSWTPFQFDGESQYVVAVGGGTCAWANQGIVAFLTSPDDNDSSEVLLSTGIGDIPATWLPLSAAQPLPLSDPIMSFDLSTTVNAILAVAFAAVTGPSGPSIESAALEWDSTLFQSPTTAPWVTGSTGSFSCAAEVLSPLGYAFSLSPQGDLNLLLPSGTGTALIEWGLNPPSPPSPGVSYNLTKVELGGLSCVPPGLATAPPYLFLNGNTPVEQQLPQNDDSTEVGSQDVFVGFMGESGPFARVLTFPLTVQWAQLSGTGPGLVNVTPPMLDGYSLPPNPDTQTIGLPKGFGSITDIACCVYSDGSEMVFVAGQSQDSGTQIAMCRSGAPTANGYYVQGTTYTEPVPFVP